MSAQSTVKTKEQRWSEFRALVDSLPEIPHGLLAGGPHLLNETNEPDPRNYRGADWSEVG